MGISRDTLFEGIGSLGGVILAAALLPQIYKVHKTKKTEDISYVWQAVYITGLVTITTYYAYFQFWSVFCPIVIELLCIIYLTALKIYFEKISPRRPGSPGKRILPDTLPTYQIDLSETKSKHQRSPTES